MGSSTDKGPLMAAEDRAGEMDQWAKWLPHKHEDPSSDSSSTGMVVSTRSSSALTDQLVQARPVSSRFGE